MNTNKKYKNSNNLFLELMYLMIVQLFLAKAVVRNVQKTLQILNLMKKHLKKNVNVVARI
jgi:hypothetical protein